MCMIVLIVSSIREKDLKAPTSLCGVNFRSSISSKQSLNKLKDKPSEKL